MALDFFRAAGSPSSGSLEQFMLLTSAKILSPYPAVALKPATPISRRLNRRAHVAIRINPAGEAEGGAMRMGGRPAPFGIDEELLD